MIRAHTKRLFLALGLFCSCCTHPTSFFLSSLVTCFKNYWYEHPAITACKKRFDDQCVMLQDEIDHDNEHVKKACTMKNYFKSDTPKKYYGFYLQYKKNKLNLKNLELTSLHNAFDQYAYNSATSKPNEYQYNPINYNRAWNYTLASIAYAVISVAAWSYKPEQNCFTDQAVKQQGLALATGIASGLCMLQAFKYSNFAKKDAFDYTFMAERKCLQGQVKNFIAEKISEEQIKILKVTGLHKEEPIIMENFIKVCLQTSSDNNVKERNPLIISPIKKNNRSMSVVSEQKKVRFNDKPEIIDLKNKKMIDHVTRNYNQIQKRKKNKQPKQLVQESDLHSRTNSTDSVSSATTLVTTVNTKPI